MRDHASAAYMIAVAADLRGSPHECPEDYARGMAELIADVHGAVEGEREAIAELVRTVPTFATPAAVLAELRKVSDAIELDAHYRDLRDAASYRPPVGRRHP